MSALAWHGSARAYLERLGFAEYCQQKAAARGRKRFHYHPSDYHRSLIDCLNRDDEEGFKALKALQGYASAAGV